MKNLPTWKALQQYFEEYGESSIQTFFDGEKDRLEVFSAEACGIFLDFSKNRISKSGFELLIELARQRQLNKRINELLSGKPVNNTEKRPAFHTALRNNGKGLEESEEQSFLETKGKLNKFCQEIHSGEWKGSTGKTITDIVNIGIGGSDLGPVMVTRALTPYIENKVSVHFVSNIDGTHISETLKSLNPQTTLFIIASKSFSTLETRKNAEAARSWCLDSGMAKGDLKSHFIAVSSNIAAAGEFGIPEDNIFPIWDWVGGRFSIWSAIGLPVALALGTANFQAFLDGARSMDEHFLSTAFEKNMPVILALLSIWYSNFYGSQAEVVIPYDHYLNKFPSFLQQLQMESNGKSVDRSGRPLNYSTAGVVFGESGSNTQHSFHQLLHQGTQFFPVDFIIPLLSHNPVSDQHEHLLANCLAQSRALMTGRSLAQIEQEMKDQGYRQEDIKGLGPHKVIPGNRPSNTIMLDKLTPYSLGALVALYEHKVYVESVIWDINAFDQWGVELGKQLGGEIFEALTGAKHANFDPSTSRLIRHFQSRRQKCSEKFSATG